MFFQGLRPLFLRTLLARDFPKATLEHSCGHKFNFAFLGQCNRVSAACVPSFRVSPARERASCFAPQISGLLGLPIFQHVTFYQISLRHGPCLLLNVQYGCRFLFLDYTSPLRHDLTLLCAKQMFLFIFSTLYS